MDKVLLRKAATQSVVLMLVVILMSFYLEQYKEVIISASNNEEGIIQIDNAEVINEYDLILKRDKIIAIEDSDEVQDSMEPLLVFAGTNDYVSNEVIKQLGDEYIVIKKPKGGGFQISLEDQYSLMRLKVLISGFMEDSLDHSYIGRVGDDEVFIGRPQYVETKRYIRQDDGSYKPIIIKDYGKDPVKEIIINSQSDHGGYSLYEIELQLNHIYAHVLYEDEHYYYIDLRKPKELYDKIIVLDAGHGGKDPGAISKDDLTYEKHINLKILLELKELLDKDNIKVYYTRLKDETLFLRPRITLANDLDCDFFISIHCNSSISTRPNGTEILYRDHVNNNIYTKDMAKIFSEELSETIPLKNGGLMKMKENDIFILENATIPAIIIETGYLSNDNDLKYLRSDNSYGEIANGIYRGIIRAYEELLPDK